MGKMGSFDFSEFEKFRDNLKAMDKAFPKFMNECVTELANRLLAEVVPRTPVGEYGDQLVEFKTKDGEDVKFWAKDSRKGGTLRRSWTIGQVTMTAAGAEIEVFNPVYYSAYVEYGHRTPNGGGWVEGRFMMTISVQKLKRELSAIVEKKMDKFLKKYLGG